MGDELARRCDELLNSKAHGEVLQWLEAARPLEVLLKGELTTATDRIRKRLELFLRRQADDERYLVGFLVRPSQVEAFERLLEPENEAWALHYAGPGGTGKTMMVRYISARLAPAHRAATSRIDFDYLSPEYPARAPGLLLAELAEEL